MRAKSFIVGVCLWTILALNGTAGATTVLIDVGKTGTFPTGNWNVISNRASGFLEDLINDQGQGTGISLAVTDAFAGTSDNGFEAATIDYPAEAKTDTWAVIATDPLG